MKVSDNCAFDVFATSATNDGQGSADRQQGKVAPITRDGMARQIQHYKYKYKPKYKYKHKYKYKY